MNKKISVLFVCLGNICRSPTAEAVFRKKVQLAGLEESISIDSAGTANYHIGALADDRSIAFAAKRNYALQGLRARQLVEADFARFDYILGMDNNNLDNLIDRQPQTSAAHVGLVLEYACNGELLEVPDPYYSGDQGFDTVLDLLEEASDGLLETIRKEHAL